jgi:gamma-glutamylcyclotransferase (GGCT)/AIG2-like uncharacterized protein YtfP
VSHHVFVYGTLRPGDVRWPLLRPFVVDEGWPDEVRGQLFDTGLDYPAAVFGTCHDAWVVGHTFTLLDHDVDHALAVLDDEEDTVLGLYRRVQVTTRRGVSAWAYEYGSGLELTQIRSGDWFQREVDHER